MLAKKYKRGRRNKNSRARYIGFFAVIVIAIGGVSYGLYLNKGPRFEKPNNVTFGIWYPVAGNKTYELQKNTLQYNTSASTITFKLKNKKDNNELTFTEQAVPESFAVAPDAFDQQVATLNQGTKFDSVNGSVALTKPFENGKTTAIMRSQGTLVYVYSDKEFSTDEWRKLFNDMELIK